MFNYYGIDWLVYALLFMHIWLLGNKKRSAWIIAIFCYFVSAIFCIQIKTIPGVISNLIFVILGIRAYMMWKPEQLTRQLANMPDDKPDKQHKATETS